MSSLPAVISEPCSGTPSRGLAAVLQKNKKNNLRSNVGVWRHLRGWKTCVQKKQMAAETFPLGVQGFK